VSFEFYKNNIAGIRTMVPFLLDILQLTVASRPKREKESKEEKKKRQVLMMCTGNEDLILSWTPLTGVPRIYHRLQLHDIIFTTIIQRLHPICREQ
jgi:hypothetical protein